MFVINSLNTITKCHIFFRNKKYFSGTCKAKNIKVYYNVHFKWNLWPNNPRLNLKPLKGNMNNTDLIKIAPAKGKKDFG